MSVHDINETDVVVLATTMRAAGYKEGKPTSEYEHSRFIHREFSTTIIYKPAKKCVMYKVVNYPWHLFAVAVPDVEVTFSQEAFDKAVAQMCAALKNHPNPLLTQVNFYMADGGIQYGVTTTGVEYAKVNNSFVRNFMGQYVKEIDT